MAYKRYVPKVPANIWEFRPELGVEMTDDDLVKISFENGEYLFVAWRERQGVVGSAAWRVDEALLPVRLAKVRAEFGRALSTFSVAERSGYRGRLLKLELDPPAYWRDSVYFLTESPIASIRPARRPRKNQEVTLSGQMKVDTSSDYH